MLANTPPLPKPRYEPWENIVEMLARYRDPNDRSARLRNRIALSLMPYVQRHVRAWYQGNDLGQDAAQDTFLFLCRVIEEKVHQTENAQHALAYLLMSAKFRVRRFWYQYYRPSVELLSFDADVGDYRQFEVALRFFDPSIEDITAELNRAIDELGDRYAAPIKLVWLEGYGLRETAKKLDLPLDELKQRLNRAKTLLGRSLMAYKYGR